MNKRIKFIGVISLVFVFAIVGIVKAVADKNNEGNSDDLLIYQSDAIDSANSDVANSDVTNSDVVVSDMDASNATVSGVIDGNSDEKVESEKESSDSSLESTQKIIVHVCGFVVNPGVYELSASSRICEAVEMAGGFQPEADQEAVNLADMLVDGMQLRIPSIEEGRSTEYGEGNGRVREENKSKDVIRIPTNVDSKSSLSDTSDSKLININTATKEELMSLSGVGESKASLIIKYRETNGAFSSIEEIMNITGIKEGLFNKVKDSICV